MSPPSTPKPSPLSPATRCSLFLSPLRRRSISRRSSYRSSSVALLRPADRLPVTCKLNYVGDLSPVLVNLSRNLFDWLVRTSNLTTFWLLLQVYVHVGQTQFEKRGSSFPATKVVSLDGKYSRLDLTAIWEYFQAPICHENSKKSVWYHVPSDELCLWQSWCPEIEVWLKP